MNLAPVLAIVPNTAGRPLLPDLAVLLGGMAFGAAAAVVVRTRGPGRAAAAPPAADQPPEDPIMAELVTSRRISADRFSADESRSGPPATAGHAARPGGRARADRLASPLLQIGVLGPLTVNGQPGALLPAQTQLLIALALADGDGLPNRRLCELLGADPAHPRPSDSLRQLIVRTRRQQGRAGDGREWIEHRGHGRYALHADAWLDWTEFGALATAGLRSRDPGTLSEALGIVRGEPFDGCYYWWLEPALVESARARVVTVATMLASISLDRGDAAGAARATRAGLAADASAEQLWRALMRAEHAAGNLAGVREAWNRCRAVVAEIAADGQPEQSTAAVYSRLLAR
jgi:DNA-binding SARP family transcriptional activator